MGSCQYELIDHSADLGVRIYGERIDKLFANAGLALAYLMAPTHTDIDEKTITITVSGSDLVDLLINWLRELLYLFYGEERLVTSVEIVSMKALTLKARVGVVCLDEDKITPGYEIKAITYHQARIEPVDTGYAATVIFDL